MTQSTNIIWANHLPAKEKNLIVKANTLIRARQQLTLQERRLIYIFVSMIRPEDKDFRMMRLNVKDIANRIGISGNNYYTTVKQIMDSLQRKIIYIYKPNSNEIHTAWVASAEYSPKRGIVEIEFSQKLKPYLLQLKREYTKFKLENVIVLNSIYSMQMYELLKQDLYKGKVIYKLADLRYMFAMAEDKYQRVSQFKARVIDRAQKEIKKKTDIEFNYQDIKSGRQIVAFLFIIRSNKNYKGVKELQIASPDDNDKYDVMQKLLRIGITKVGARKIISKYSEKRILNNLDYIKSKRKKYENIAGSVVAAIENDYVQADNHSLTDDDLINGFIDRYERKIGDEFLPIFILKDMFNDWIKNKEHIDNKKIDDLWKKYGDEMYKEINHSDNSQEDKDSKTKVPSKEDKKRAKELEDYLNNI